MPHGHRCQAEPVPPILIAGLNATPSPANVNAWGFSRRTSEYFIGTMEWRNRPGEKIVARWCEQFPDANIGVLPGLSGPGAVVFDCDTADAADEVQDRFGKSDMQVVTRRGRHLWYATVPFRLPGNLRRLGLDVDIKAGNQIVIAPPSVHETGHIYRLDHCDWDALGHLRRLNADQLHRFLHDPKQENAKIRHEMADVGLDREMRHDSRGLWLNDTLCAYAPSCTEVSEVLSIAHHLNEKVGEMHPSGRLPDDEVIERAMRVWQDAAAGKIQLWGAGRRSVVRMTAEEIDGLSPDALKLLSKLRAEHSARCARGETFAIQATAMAKAKFMSRHRIEKARAILLHQRKIELVRPMLNSAAGRKPAQFRLLLHDR